MLSTKDGKMIILSSPSGAGKTTLVKKISKEKIIKFLYHTQLENQDLMKLMEKTIFLPSQNKFQKLIKKKHF